MDGPSTSYGEIAAPPSEQERSTAALGYVLWPLALGVVLNAGPKARSEWSLTHARRAIKTGLIATAVLIVFLAAPLILVIAGGFDSSLTLLLYSAAFIADAIVAIVIGTVIVTRARKAARGDAA